MLYLYRYWWLVVYLVWDFVVLWIVVMVICRIVWVIYGRRFKVGRVLFVEVGFVVWRIGGVLWMGWIGEIGRYIIRVEGIIVIEDGWRWWWRRVRFYIWWVGRFVFVVYWISRRVWIGLKLRMKRWIVRVVRVFGEDVRMGRRFDMCFENSRLVVCVWRWRWRIKVFRSGRNFKRVVVRNDFWFGFYFFYFF